MKRFAATILLVLGPCVILAVYGPVLLGSALFAVGARGLGATLMHNAGWRGFELGRRGDCLGAARVFGSAPTNSYNKGNMLALAGRYKDALDAYDVALQADPEDDDARHNKALVVRVLEARPASPGRLSGDANASAVVESHGGDIGDKSSEHSSSGVGYAGSQASTSSASTQGSSKISKASDSQTEESGLDSAKGSGSAGQAAGRGRSGGNLVDAIQQQLAINQRKYARAYTQLNVKPTVEWLQTVTDDPGSWLKLQIRAERKRRDAERDTGVSDN